ncbi:MAG: hypothetical protein OEM38_10600 [Gammaproteobacteria bacterium]|nr:hypothetical protein [Gammaproteobacteria bacterium]
MDKNENDLHEEAKQVADSNDIREKVRLITLKALSERQLDKESINSVVKSIIEGVSEGLGESSEKLKPQLQASMSGIDDALSKSAIAAKLATEEAIGRAEKFAESDLKKAVEDFKGLEDSFIDTINTVARGSGSLVSTALGEIASHLKKTGTDSGKEAINAVNSLSHSLVDAGKGTVDEIASATQSATGHFASIASGVLAGMADVISSGKKPKS